VNEKHFQLGARLYSMKERISSTLNSGNCGSKDFRRKSTNEGVALIWSLITTLKDLNVRFRDCWSSWSFSFPRKPCVLYFNKNKREIAQKISLIPPVQRKRFSFERDTSRNHKQTDAKSGWEPTKPLQCPSTK